MDPSRPNHVGLSMDVADMAAFEAVMQSEADGVRRGHADYVEG